MTFNVPSLTSSHDAYSIAQNPGSESVPSCIRHIRGHLSFLSVGRLDPAAIPRDLHS